MADEEDTADELPTDFSPNMIDRCVAVGLCRPLGSWICHSNN